MTNDSLITWAIVVIVALVLDFGIYIWLLTVWKKSGVVLTDQFWDVVTERLSQMVEEIWANFQKALPKLPAKKPVVALQSAGQPPALPPLPSDDVREPSVETIPVSVKKVGKLRKVAFSFDMPLETKVNVRIGPTSDDEIKVEKHEL